jgi:pimeloyl-ACP methyl ester carboxylesterase
MQTSEGEYRRLPVGDGGDVGYHDSGRGKAIILVHAGVFSDWFRPFSLQLPRDRFRVVRVRRAGYRDTTRQAGHLALADHARHAAVLLDELGIGAAHWVGHSSSCLIGLQLAQDRPGLVASLTLLEPAPGGDLHGPADEKFVEATVRPAMEAFFAGDLGGAFDRFMRGIGGPGYPAVLTSQLGPAGLGAALAQLPGFQLGRRCPMSTAAPSTALATIRPAFPDPDVQEAASHADPRTTMRYDRARGSQDRHATYTVAAYVAAAAR